METTRSADAASLLRNQFRVLESVGPFDADARRRVLLLPHEDWSQWSAFMQGEPLPTHPPAPVMLQRVATVAYRLAALADCRSAARRQPDRHRGNAISSHNPKLIVGLLLGAALIGTVAAVASFIMDWSPATSSGTQSATSAQHSRLPQHPHAVLRLSQLRRQSSGRTGVSLADHSNLS